MVQGMIPRRAICAHQWIGKWKPLRRSFAWQLSCNVPYPSMPCVLGGPLLDTLNKKFGKKKGDKPPRIYFHAFGGKAAQINQINAACRGTDEVFYGFAPCVNFRSPKTADVIRAIGIDSLVLESDRENYTAVREDLEANAQFIADALDMQKDDVVQKTAANARRFYGLA